MKLNKLQEYIKENTIVARSPGRINLIGEHTDYNEGFVLPAAVDRSIYVALTPREDQEIHLHSLDLNEHYLIEIKNLKISDTMWANYILGVVDQFIMAGIPMRGFELAFTGEIPMGGGLSSSAAMECSVGWALNKFLKADLDKMALVKMARQAEHKYTGVKCGIMDQFASVFGQANKVIKLDCRSLEYEYIDFTMKGIKIVLYDTNVKHSLASSEYNTRLGQCYAGVALIAKHIPAVKSLRDATMEMVQEYILPHDELIYKRCKYVVEENARLLGACEDLKNKDMVSFGKKMFETHNGLSVLYDVSCPELDFLVDNVRDNPNVLGSRMMGGGFGGCTINLVLEEAYYDLTTHISRAYRESMKRELTVHEVKLGHGSSYLEHLSHETK